MRWTGLLNYRNQSPKTFCWLKSVLLGDNIQNTRWHVQLKTFPTAGLNTRTNIQVSINSAAIYWGFIIWIDACLSKLTEENIPATYSHATMDDSFLCARRILSVMETSTSAPFHFRLNLLLSYKYSYTRLESNTYKNLHTETHTQTSLQARRLYLSSLCAYTKLLSSWEHSGKGTRFHQYCHVPDRN